MAPPRLGLLVACLALLGAAEVAAGPVALQGRVMVVAADPEGNEPSRFVKVVARLSPAGANFFSDPTLAGATLKVYVYGRLSSEAVFVLPAEGWSATRNGFRYRPPSVDGPPVQSVVLRRAQDGTASLIVKLAGDAGALPLEILTPDPGVAGGLELKVKRGKRYCVGLGGVLGGTATANTSTRWRIASADSPAACPCVPEGTDFLDFDLERAFACCGGLGFPLTSTVTYCGRCLPDGYWTFFGCEECCSGTCSASPVRICGADCIPQDQCDPETAYLCCNE
jgi:hypothetical protein